MEIPFMCMVLLRHYSAVSLKILENGYAVTGLLKVSLYKTFIFDT